VSECFILYEREREEGDPLFFANPKFFDDSELRFGKRNGNRTERNENETEKKNSLLYI
jgi:hypothetical protein